MRSRAAGRLSGAALLERVAAAYDPSLRLAVEKRDGDELQPGDVIATFHGLLRSILAMERTALNFVCHLSGIATLTAKYVEAVAGTTAKIYDTRKTVPGLRGLAKYAVACGGGHAHRRGLFDAVLIKDNHIAQLPDDDLAGRLREAVGKARRSSRTAFVEIEVDSLDQLAAALAAGADIVLLDNMTPSQMQQAVKARDEKGKGVELEASGGVNLDTVRGVAEAGVDRIAIGALTHSAPALDVGLDVR